MTNVWCGILCHSKVIALVHKLIDTPSYIGILLYLGKVLGLQGLLVVCVTRKMGVR